MGTAVAPFMPAAAPRILDQLGYDWAVRRGGNGGPDVLGVLEWGAMPGPGRVTDAPTPLFPRLETEVAASPEG